MALLRLLCFCLAVAAVPARALEPFAGFRDLPWGASEADILAKDLGKVVSSNLVYIKQFQESEEGAVLLNYFMLSPTKELVIEAKRKGLLRFFLVRDRLCFVVQRPDITRVFSPARVIEEVQAALPSVPKPLIRKDLSLPQTWGRLSSGQETFEILDWQNDKGHVRVACRTWPGGERREVFAVCHFSLELMADNQRIAEDERRKAEEEARRKAEEERKAAEAAAKAKAAAEAAAAAAAGQPPPKR